ncbi:citrate transporter [Propioniferax innocua]|uniref:Na+/H+ antiporter NhaD/arsenite permease-like protein n=1 Tax=Propioniferax innocua TaxID=1753 RepID=A0A542ZQG1_9ACTN|nr:citrate transporter [Propioniferax innocua]TQL62516.1 Na+/H+ antiporter NhaD/arsenite permease-like protein [Propioniferax innocua]
MLIAAQIIMVLTLVLMVWGKTPLYSTAVIGSALAALVAGIPIISSDEEATTIRTLIGDGLNPVIADMAGVLVFIGIMEAVGFLDVLVKAIIRLGNRFGGGPGVASSGGIAAGLIGAFTGFTQPAITAVVTGPASTKLGVSPSKSAGVHAHAGHLGNFAGFTHPTLLAVIATAGIKFGWINVIGLATALTIFGVSFLRMRGDLKGKEISGEERDEVMKQFAPEEGEPSVWLALLPFVLLVIGFALGYPVFAVGFVVSVIVMALGRYNPLKGEEEMLKSVQRVAVPLIATVGFLFMSGVIGEIGIVPLMAGLFEPLLTSMPILTLVLVSAVAGLLTQSNSASAAIILPFLTLVMAQDGINPLAAAAAAAGPTAVMQYFLTGGPVAALATAIPVIPGSDLKTANRFQRPSILAGLGFVGALAIVLGFF